MIPFVVCLLLTVLVVVLHVFFGSASLVFWPCLVVTVSSTLVCLAARP